MSDGAAPISTSTVPKDEFYIGYMPKAPEEQARHTRLLVGAHIVFSALVATLVVLLMRDPGDGVWIDTAAGNFLEFEGVVRERPYPMLTVTADTGGLRRGHAALLVDFGKRGAQARIAGLEGRRIRAAGTLLQRDGRSIIELAPDAFAPGSRAVRPLDDGSAPPSPVSPSEQPVTYSGEIVDPKCFLGAMKPGDGKTHKACAVRCIGGGIPPVLVTWDRAGRGAYYVLVDASGGPTNDTVLPWVGEFVTVRGRAGHIDDLQVLFVAPRGVSQP